MPAPIQTAPPAATEALPERLREPARELALFERAVLAGPNTEPPTATAARLRLHLFFLGAGLQLMGEYDLSATDFDHLAFDHLYRHGLDEARATRLVETLQALDQDPTGAAAVREGTETMALWRGGKDPNVALRLGELLHRWVQDAPY